MNIRKTFADLSQYFSVAIARIFGPNDNSYPEVGVQPFSGNRSRKQER
ncbi:MAG: isochorismate synthase [Spirulinaceae cyanobacterium RM2_2_10]|nr:isochorismate synthase [Spirulinaceae cyanobacterium SM2_1_0]NJO19835.1 isochorismate synthase [Spirulinaceae cyanobacterium RM2_2_10]